MPGSTESVVGVSIARTSSDRFAPARIMKRSTNRGRREPLRLMSTEVCLSEAIVSGSSATANVGCVTSMTGIFRFCAVSA